jgi:hypothetical protein
MTAAPGRARMTLRRSARRYFPGLIWSVKISICPGEMKGTYSDFIIHK